jgi:hypothetical protein
MRAELNAFLRQDHMAKAPINETLTRMDQLARALTAKPAVPATAPQAGAPQARPPQAKP